jgi:hypothetical protein
MFLAHIMRFLEVRCSWEPGTRVSTGIISPFCLFSEGFWRKCPLGDRVSYLFFLSKSSNWCFLAWHKPPLSQRSTARGWNLQGISNLVNKVDCCLSEDSCWTTSQALFAPDCVPAGSLHFVPFDSADLPCYEILRSGLLNGPLPYGTLLKVSPKERHTPMAVVPNCIGVQWVWLAWVGADRSRSLFLRSSCSSGILRLLLLTTSQSGVCL